MNGPASELPQHARSPRSTSPSWNGHANRGTQDLPHSAFRDEVPLSTQFHRWLAASGLGSFNDEAFARFLEKTPASGPWNGSDMFRFPTKHTVWTEGKKDSFNSYAEAEQNGGATPCTYLAGNSLGLMTLKMKDALAKELEAGVLGHTEHDEHNWVTIDGLVVDALARLVGGKVSEVACMGSLTANLHALFTTFYKPTPRRHKIMFEGKAFPSDAYAFASHVALHDYPPSSLLPIDPHQGEYTLRTEDILKMIEDEGDSIAIICFGAIQYYTGQWFDMQAITEAGHAKGCLVAFDCAHAVGNVPLRLHEWGVDFAAWCSYKYLNAGPGGIAGIFVHERHAHRKRLQGWWGHDTKTRFHMPPAFVPIPGTAGWQFSNPSVLDVIALHTALHPFREAMLLRPPFDPSQTKLARFHGLDGLRNRSIHLTGYLELLLQSSPSFVPVESLAGLGPDESRLVFTIITPSAVPERGSQLSILFEPPEAMEFVLESLRDSGVLGDERRPGVIRLAPTALYSTFVDCQRAAKGLDSAVHRWKAEGAAWKARRAALKERRHDTKARRARRKVGENVSPTSSEEEAEAAAPIRASSSSKIDPAVQPRLATRQDRTTSAVGVLDASRSALLYREGRGADAVRRSRTTQEESVLQEIEALEQALRSLRASDPVKDISPSWPERQAATEALAKARRRYNALRGPGGGLDLFPLEDLAKLRHKAGGEEAVAELDAQDAELERQKQERQLAE